MLERVFERASRARYLSRLVVATDDERIAREARRIGAPVVMTRADHPSGTDRVAEVAASEAAELVVNIQGDEPLIEPEAIDAAVLGLLEARDVPMGTLKKRIADARELASPNVVKVVNDREGNAIYFSRLPIPSARDGGPVERWKHVGLYVYRREFLLRYPRLPVGPLERAERLEQLRALENGYRIRVVETEYDSIPVDTPEDLQAVEQLFALGAGAGVPGE